MLRNRLLGLLIISITLFWSLAWYCNRPNASGIPAIRYPELIDLGECEAGQIATAEFEISNDGTAELHVAGIRSSCSCAGLETRQPDGQFSKVEALSLQPGERKSLAIRLAVNGQLGASLRSAIYFQTNDPLQSEVTLVIQLRRIKAGAFSQPITFAFGTATVNQSVSKVVDIIDAVSPPRAVDRVGTSNPELIKFTRLSVPESEIVTPIGCIVARMRIEVKTDVPADIDERLNVWLINEKPSSPVSVRVQGCIAESIEFAPKTLVLLPTQGEPQKGMVLCLTQGRSAAVRIVECPRGFTAEVAKAFAPTAPRQISISRTTPGPSVTVQVRVGVTLDGVETIHSFPVRCDSVTHPEAPS